METILQVKGLVKSFGTKTAVNNISFEVSTGQKFVFVGPNGAGKTTTIRIISTLLSKDSGEVRYADLELGKDNDAIRRKIGVVFQDHVLDNELTVRENLAIRGSFYSLTETQIRKRIDVLTNLLEMEKFVNQRYETLSGGQKRRADIARALMQEPEILFLDEPTTGLDPQTRRIVWGIIDEIRQRLRMTVFLTTHYMEETEDADHVVIIDDGVIIGSGTPADLRKQYAPNVLWLYPKSPESFSKILQEQGTAFSKVHGAYQIGVETSFDALPLVERWREHLNGFEVNNGSMDDVFIVLTGKEIRE